ncbi:MAG: SGNH/GDSL hydrolase family protein [Clostridia bacterium]|nr:SGNH/GDSL hydrolase family protein [Clostridia bacterium]
MKISEKIRLEKEGLEKYGPIIIVALGDSVTHGAVADNEINYETVYWNRLRQKINQVRNYVPVNVINAGIGGGTAQEALPRLEKQVFNHLPDLVIVCFGLNDVNRPLEDFLSALEKIFTACKDFGCDVIYMTPNMLNTYVAEGTSEVYKEYAKKTAEMQNGGRMDKYMAEACSLAQKMGVPVCDCYSKWKKLSETEDTTQLLANYINHPTKEMHRLFADSLFEMLFPENTEKKLNDSTMYEEKI